MSSADISRRFNQNLSRVENLIEMYDREGQGRRGAHEADVLRAAIVLLHAALEDFLRSHLVDNIGGFDPETLDSYGFPSDHKRRQDKITLGQLAKHGRISIKRFVQQTVQERIERYETFNDAGDINGALRKCGFNTELIEGHDLSLLAEMITRRHQIVHKADRNENVGGRGNHRIASISVGVVNRYLESVREFKEIVDQIVEEA